MTGALDFLKPLAWLATIAFLVGFVSYLALGQPSSARAGTPAPHAALVSFPASDDWNLPKQI
jgi:hypothetical protein